jgi:hypothetical protein
MGIIDDTKEVVKLVQQIDNIPLYHKILDLEGDVIELVQQNREKDEMIEKLKKAMELKGKMICESSAYYQVDEEGNKIAGPFCTNCFDNEYATRRLVSGFRPNDQVGHSWAWVQCPKCRNPFCSEPIGRYLNTY